MPKISSPIGSITRGTTGTNRLRRVDRFIAQLPALRQAKTPLVVDLGYGASATTSLELHQRLARVRPSVEVVGIEIDPARVALAALSARQGVSFRLGGFEVPLDGGRGATVIRAMNVLRQYDEVGRVASWVDVSADGPLSLTISLRLADLGSAADSPKPSTVAERLPKILIHRNVPGEPVHAFLEDLDRQWQVNAPLSVYGGSQRWIATAEALRSEGWPVLGSRSRWKLGEITVEWRAVAPKGFAW
jgi:hypothetical protein